MLGRSPERHDRWRNTPLAAHIDCGAIWPEIVIPLSKNAQIMGNENTFSQIRTRRDVSLDFFGAKSRKRRE